MYMFLTPHLCITGTILGLIENPVAKRQTLLMCSMYVLTACVFDCSVEKVGRKFLGREVYQYTITTDLDVELPYVILVWAFTSSGDQEAARYELPPAIGEEKRVNSGVCC